MTVSQDPASSRECAAPTGDSQPVRLTTWHDAARLILIGAPIATVTTLVCVFWVDLPLATWLHGHGWDSHAWMRWLMVTPIVLVPMAGLYLLVHVLRRSCGSVTRHEHVAFVLCSGLLVSQEIKDMLKRAFGRTWPRDVSDLGTAPPSADCAPASLGYINDGLHSFTLFAGATKPFQAFPSGSTSALLTVALPIMVLYPRTRLPLGVFLLASLSSLVITNTHFLGDIFGGVYVGAVAACICLAVLGAPRGERSN